MFFNVSPPFHPSTLFHFHHRPKQLLHLLGGSKEAEEENKDDDDEDDEEEEDNTRQVRKLLNVLFQGDAAGALFKELSVLISDPGAPRQQLHPDNAYQTICPLYTVFIALQDITTEMGPTVFLPRTNTQQCHEDFNNEVNGESSSRTPDDGSGGNDSFLKSREWSTSLLKRGDVQILDSMTIHAATANSTVDQRRALLYFTFKNPLCVDYGKSNTPSITKGSLFDDVDMCFGDYSCSYKK